MSTTMTVCATCGGIRASRDAKVNGRRCSCTGAHSVAVNTAGVAVAGAVATASIVGTKLCSVCNADVTDKKRMKDSATGKYWCYECYVIEQRKKNAGMTMRCPHCLKDHPPLKMVKHGEAYWCESCHDEQQSKGKKRKPNPNGEAGKPATGGQSKKLIAVGVAAAAIAAAYWFFMV